MIICQASFEPPSTYSLQMYGKFNMPHGCMCLVVSRRATACVCVCVRAQVVTLAQLIKTQLQLNEKLTLLTSQ